MKYRAGSFFFAAVLCSAGAAFADEVRLERVDRDVNSVPAMRLPHKGDLRRDATPVNFSSTALEEGMSRIEATSHGLIGDLGKSHQTADLGAMLIAQQKSNIKHPILFEPGASRNGARLFKKDHHRQGEEEDGGDNGGSGNGPAPVVAVPEPSASTLLLFGLAGLGMFFLRRTSLRNAI